MVPNQTPIPTDFFCIYATSVFRAQLLSTGSRWHSLIQTQTVFALHLHIGIRIWTYKSHTYIVQWVMTLGVTMRTWIQTKIVPSKWSQHICSRVCACEGSSHFSSIPYITNQPQQQVGSCNDRHTKSTDFSQKAGSALLAAVPLYRQLLYP